MSTPRHSMFSEAKRDSLQTPQIKKGREMSYDTSIRTDPDFSEPEE